MMLCECVQMSVYLLLHACVVVAALCVAREAFQDTKKHEDSQLHVISDLPSDQFRRSRDVRARRAMVNGWIGAVVLISALFWCGYIQLYQVTHEHLLQIRENARAMSCPSHCYCLGFTAHPTSLHRTEAAMDIVTSVYSEAGAKSVDCYQLHEEMNLNPWPNVAYLMKEYVMAIGTFVGSTLGASLAAFLSEFTLPVQLMLSASMPFAVIASLWLMPYLPIFRRGGWLHQRERDQEMRSQEALDQADAARRLEFRLRRIEDHHPASYHYPQRLSVAPYRLKEFEKCE
jgi:hypothetical protein